MKRRELLGLCAGGGLVGLAGCLDLAADTVARTRAYPAFALPPVGEWRGRLDGDGSGSGSLRVQNHNTTRSNRTQPVPGPDGGPTVEWSLTASEYRSRNFNSGRAAGDRRTFDAPVDDRERTYAYLEDNPVISETFVVSVPSVDLPGVDDPAAQIAPGDIIPGAGSFADGGGTPRAVIAELIAFSGLSDVTGLGAASDGPVPLYDGATRRSSGDAGPFVVQWKRDRRSDSNGAEVSEPVLASATATLNGGVRLPVILYGRRLRHGGDYLFVVGWVVDAGALYADAATLLVDAAPNQVVGVPPAQVRRRDPPAALVDSLTEREQLGALLFDGPAREDLRRYLPAQLRDGDGAETFVEVVRRGSGAARAGRDQGPLRVPAFEATDDDPPEDEVIDLTVVSLDGTVAHLDAPYAGDFEDQWMGSA